MINYVIFAFQLDLRQQRAYDASPYVRCISELQRLIVNMDGDRNGIGILTNLTHSLQCMRNSIDQNLFASLGRDMNKIPRRPEGLDPLVTRILDLPMVKKPVTPMQPYSLQWFHIREVLRLSYRVLVKMVAGFLQYDLNGHWKDSSSACTLEVAHIVNSWYFNVLLIDHETRRTLQMEWLSEVYTLFRILPTFIPALENPENITWFDLIRFQTWRQYGFRFIEDGCVVCLDEAAMDFKVFHPCRHTCCVDCFKSLCYRKLV